MQEAEQEKLILAPVDVGNQRSVEALAKFTLAWMKKTHHGPRLPSHHKRKEQLGSNMLGELWPCVCC